MQNPQETTRLISSAAMTATMCLLQHILLGLFRQTLTLFSTFLQLQQSSVCVHSAEMIDDANEKQVTPPEDFSRLLELLVIVADYHA